MEIIEEWRPITDWPYEVSNLGFVRRTKTRRILMRCNSLGYFLVCLCKPGHQRTFFIHALVCRAFHGEPPSPQHETAHNDGIRTNCRYDNLRWATPSENQRDRFRHGTILIGSAVPNSVLNEKIVRGVRERHAELKHNGRKRLPNGALTKIAEEFGITRSQVHRLTTGSHGGWHHVNVPGIPASPLSASRNRLSAGRNRCR